MVEYVNNIVDFGSEYLNRELMDVFKKNYHNGYHRIIAIINALREQGYNDIEIAKEIKSMEYYNLK